MRIIDGFRVAREIADSFTLFPRPVSVRDVNAKIRRIQRAIQEARGDPTKNVFPPGKPIGSLPGNKPRK